MVDALWRYRHFIVGMVTREFQARYLDSLLGTLWAVASPLATIIIYWLIFGRMMKARLAGLDDDLAYAVFLCAGVPAWGYFTEVLTRCLTIFNEQANLMKKMSFPRSALAAIALLSATVNFGIVLAVVLVFLVIVGRFPGISLLAFLPLLVLQQTLAVALGVALGTINVFVRDVAHAVGVVLQFWFWFTPLVYPAQILGDTMRGLLALNPMFAIIRAYQDIILYDHWPAWGQFAPHLALVAAATVVALFTFRRLSRLMVDYL